MLKEPGRFEYENFDETRKCKEFNKRGGPGGELGGLWVEASPAIARETEQRGNDSQVQNWADGEGKQTKVATQRADSIDTVRKWSRRDRSISLWHFANFILLSNFNSRPVFCCFLVFCNLKVSLKE